MEAQNPLDQLRPNHLPDPVGLWPPAIGWWVLTAIVITLLALLAIYIYRRWKKNRYRTIALHQASKVFFEYQAHQSPHCFARDCNELLKRVALHAYPEDDVAGLNGEYWCQFLAETGSTPEFLNNSAFNNDRYNPKASLHAEDIYTLTRRWIKKHHA